MKKPPYGGFFAPHRRKRGLPEELRPFGIACVNRYSDAGGKPYEENSPTLCAVVKKREA